jgi:DNA-binding NarL/FixJ family response regulator
VAYLLAQGRSNNEIAAGLHVSVHTVKSQVQSILRKRGLRSRWQLVAASVTEGNPAARPERSLLGG